jgi:pimeloyl-ACP methyl ester carboxylesterase
VHAVSGVFLPGWGGRAHSYTPGLPGGWQAWQPPSFADAPTLAHLTAWLRRRLHPWVGPLDLAGHSMGAALALLAAAEYPQGVRSLTLVSPAGLPLAKPMWRSAATFARQLADRSMSIADAAASAGPVLRAPGPALAVARAVKALDLSEAMSRLYASRVRVTVLACTTDTLVTPWHARRIAELCGARLEELDLRGGHMWMFRHWDVLADRLGAADVHQD